MVIDRSSPWITLFLMVGVWNCSIPGVDAICPEHCLKNLAPTNTCLMKDESIVVNSLKINEGGRDSPSVKDGGQRKTTGGLDDHSNCREVDQGNLIYQFKLTDSGERCTKCSCQYGEPSGSDPSCEYAPHEECIKLGLNPVLRPSNNNKIHVSDYERPDNGQPELSQPSRPGSKEPTEIPDFIKDYESEYNHPSLNPDSSQVGVADPFSKPGEDYFVSGEDSETVSPVLQPESNLDTDPDYVPSLKKVRPISRFPSRNRYSPRPHPPSNLATSHRFGVRPQPERRPPNIQALWHLHHPAFSN